MKALLHNTHACSVQNSVGIIMLVRHIYVILTNVQQLLTYCNTDGLGYDSEVGGDHDVPLSSGY